MNQFIFDGDGRESIAIEANNVGEARSAAESIVAGEATLDPDIGFRWVRVRPNIWRYQLVDERGTVVASIDLTSV